MIDLKLPTFAPFAIGHGIEFCFNCRGLLYLLIPGLFITLAHRQNWHGIYQCLIPHCVTLSWLQICIISSQSAVLVEMVRGTLSLAGLLFCLPLFGLVTLMIPVFVTVESLGLTNAVHRLIASVSIAGIALIVSCLLATYRRTKKYITMIQVNRKWATDSCCPISFEKKNKKQIKVFLSLAFNEIRLSSAWRQHFTSPKSISTPPKRIHRPAKCIIR